MVTGKGLAEKPHPAGLCISSARCGYLSAVSTNDPDMSLNDALAATLNGERVRAGLTFDALATKSGISKRQLMRLLSTAERDIDVPVLDTLAAVFHTSSSQLVADAEEWRSRPSGDTHEVPERAPENQRSGE